MTTDPYAPPPRHKDRSGAIVRFLFIAALIGAAGWGYMQFANQETPALVAEEPQQTMATNEDGYENGYEVTARAPDSETDATAPADEQPAG